MPNCVWPFHHARFEQKQKQDAGMSMIQYIEVVPHLPLEPHSDAGGALCGTE